MQLEAREGKRKPDSNTYIFRQVNKIAVLMPLSPRSPATSHAPENLPQQASSQNCLFGLL